MVTTTPFTVNSSALGGSLAVIIALLLLVLLAQKDLTATAKDSRTRKLSRALSIAIIPLVIAFLIIAAVRLMEILR